MKMAAVVVVVVVMVFISLFLFVFLAVIFATPDGEQVPDDIKVLDCLKDAVDLYWLVVLYLMQYMPTIGYWLMDLIGGNRVEAAARKGNTYSFSLPFGRNKAS